MKLMQIIQMFFWAPILLGCQETSAPTQVNPGPTESEEKITVALPPQALPRRSVTGAQAQYLGPEPADISCQIVLEDRSYRIALNLPAEEEEVTSAWFGRTIGDASEFFGPLPSGVATADDGSHYSVRARNHLFDLSLQRVVDSETGIVSWFGRLVASVNEGYLQLVDMDCVAPDIALPESNGDPSARKIE